MKKSDLSTQEKLNLLLEALALISVTVEDALISHYCAKLLEELGEYHRVHYLCLSKTEKN